MKDLFYCIFRGWFLFIKNYHFYPSLDQNINSFRDDRKKFRTLNIWSFNQFRNGRLAFKIKLNFTLVLPEQTSYVFLNAINSSQSAFRMHTEHGLQFTCIKFFCIWRKAFKGRRKLRRFRRIYCYLCPWFVINFHILSNYNSIIFIKTLNNI